MVDYQCIPVNSYRSLDPLGLGIDCMDHMVLARMDFVSQLQTPANLESSWFNSILVNQRIIFTWLLWWRWFEAASSKRIALVSFFTVAVWNMSNHIAQSIETTNSNAWIFTF